MSEINKDHNKFRSAADELNPQPRSSSWDRLETMLENNSLHDKNTRLQVKNKSYRNKIKWLSGIAACLMLFGMSSLFFVDNQVNFESTQQIAYKTENIELNPIESSHIYDIKKLSILNDAQTWSKIVEGGPEPKLRIQ